MLDIIIIMNLKWAITIAYTQVNAGWKLKRHNRPKSSFLFSLLDMAKICKHVYGQELPKLFQFYAAHLRIIIKQILSLGPTVLLKPHDIQISHSFP